MSKDELIELCDSVASELTESYFLDDDRKFSKEKFFDEIFLKRVELWPHCSSLIDISRSDFEKLCLSSRGTGQLYEQVGSFYFSIFNIHTCHPDFRMSITGKVIDAYARKRFGITMSDMYKLISKFVNSEMGDYAWYERVAPYYLDSIPYATSIKFINSAEFILKRQVEMIETVNKFCEMEVVCSSAKVDDKPKSPEYDPTSPAIPPLNPDWFGSDKETDDDDEGGNDEMEIDDPAISDLIAERREPAIIKDVKAVDFNYEYSQFQGMIKYARGALKWENFSYLIGVVEHVGITAKYEGKVPLRDVGDLPASMFFNAQTSDATKKEFASKTVHDYLGRTWYQYCIAKKGRAIKKRNLLKARNKVMQDADKIVLKRKSNDNGHKAKIAAVVAGSKADDNTSEVDEKG